MTVMGMLMPVAGLIKVRYNGDKADIDSSFFKLHYRTTTTIFFISTILVTSYGMIGKPIDCMGDGIPGNVLNTYCWIMSTFSIPSQNAAGKGINYAYQGVEPANGLPEGEQIRHAYYQWVPFVLFLQGLMFYLPHWLWKTFEGGRLQKITSGLRGRTLDVETRKSQLGILVKYVKETMKLNQWYAGLFILCDFLNFVNVIGQMFFINKFLNGVFMSYGTEVLNWSEMNAEDRTDPLVEIFPRLTKCTFHKYGHSGTIEKHDALCLLALNIISEKIYVFVWFWLIILAVLTAGYMIYTIAVIAIPSLRKIMLQRNAKTKYGNDDRLDLLMRKADLGDWFLIFLLSKNLDSILFKEFISQLSEKLKTEP